jgi:hypothetical protein
MAYDSINDVDFLKNITNYKEFYQLHPDQKDKKKCDDVDQTIIPKCLIDKKITDGNYLIPKSYQLFGKIFINPNTSYSRLLIKHNTGSGKTAHALGIAAEFISLFQQETSIGYHTIGSIFIMGFENSRKAFERELFRYAEFGFVTREEVRTYNTLVKKASSSRRSDTDRLNEFTNRIRRKLSNRKNNGFFKFMGYKTFASRLFITSKNISGLQESEIMQLIKSGDVKINMSLLNTFKNSLMICDEVHNIYNSSYKNNWGVAIQVVLDMVPTLRAVLLSATPINNSPTEVVDLINLLVPPDKHVNRDDMFTKSGVPVPGAIEKLTNLSIGRVSYLMDVDAKYFPSKRFIGESIAGISYLKFTRCPMSKFHAATYEHEMKSGSVSIDGQYVLDIAYPNPNSNELGIYKLTGVKSIQAAPNQWHMDNKITVRKDSGTISGAFAHVSNIGKYSAKYHTMITDVLNIVKNKKGKIFIYHPRVDVSGVLFIGEVLSQNGIIENNSASAANTLCSKCGIANGEHTDDNHKFNAARYIVINSSIGGRIIERNMEKYNTPRNAQGQDIMVVIGSRIMQESREVRNTENLMVLHKPDNISALIQIIGRVVRTNSHSDLPDDRHNVDVRIYVSSYGDGSDKLTYEENKYREKIADYKTIQMIEKKIHEVAVDSSLNHPFIKKALTKDSIGDLIFKPKYDFKELPLNDMRLSTFTVYHTHTEMKYIIYVIKRLFVEVSQVWTYNQLWAAVQSTDFTLPVNSRMFSEDNFAIALNQLTWGVKNDVLITDTKMNKRKFLDRLFDQYDRRIVLPSSIVHGSGVEYGAIVQKAEYYILFPMDKHNIRTGVDMQYRIFLQTPPKYVNIRSYLEKSATPKGYTDRKLRFKQMYENAPLSKMSDTICTYGIDFHTQFVENCIEYIFNIWTDPNKPQSEYHEFYFKMIYYYDIIGVIVWASTLTTKLHKLYKEFLLDIPHQAATKPSNIEVDISKSISKMECSWCPSSIKDLYQSTLSSSLSRFADMVKNTPSGADKIKVDPNTLPVGHLLRDVPNFYIPESEWFASSDYGVQHDWKDNDIVVGFGDKSKKGVHVRFKLRDPIHKMKKVDDVRQQQRGTICASINKTDLLKTAKSIGVDIEKINVYKLCDEIKARLLYLDLEERRKKTNIRYYYRFYESQPVIN